MLAGSATRPPRGAGTAANLEAARLVAVEVLRQPDAAGLSINALAVLVRERTPAGVSLKAAETIVREARRQLLLDGQSVPEDYGLQLLLDCCAISLRLRVYRKDELALLSVVLDGATGLILSSVVSDRQGSAKAQVQALRRARLFINNVQLDRAGSETELLAIAPPAAAMQQEEYVSGLERAIGADRIVKKGSGRFGRQAIRRIGRRLGPVHLIPRATEHGTADAADVSASGREAVSRQLADRIIEDAIYRHNAPILQVLNGARGEAIGDVADGCGSMTRVLERILTEFSQED